MSKWAIAPMICVLALGLLVAGCGSDSDSDDGETLTKAAFVKQANALCVEHQKEMQKKFEATLKDLTSAKDKASQEDLFTAVVEESVVPGFEAEVNGIEDLGAPSGDEAQVEAVVGALQQVVDDAKANPEEFLRTAGQAYDKAQGEAAKYGLDACGTPNKPPSS